MGPGTGWVIINACVIIINHYVLISKYSLKNLEISLRLLLPIFCLFQPPHLLDESLSIIDAHLFNAWSPHLPRHSLRSLDKSGLGFMRDGGPRSTIIRAMFGNL